MADFDLTKVVPIYQAKIDRMINQLGKNVVLHFKKTITPSKEGSEFRDIVRENDTRIPSFKETNTDSAPVVVENTKTIKALIKYNPKDYANFDIDVKNPNGILRLKTFLYLAPYLERCEFIVPNIDSQDVIDSRYILMRQIVPVGLSIDRYCISYWKSV